MEMKMLQTNYSLLRPFLKYQRMKYQKIMENFEKPILVKEKDQHTEAQFRNIIDSNSY